MMGGHGKGGEYEREICRRLSEWWGSGEDTFWRNRTRKTTKGGAYQCGDVTSQEGDGYLFVSRYNVECKKGYAVRKLTGTSTRINWDILDLIDGRAEKHIFHTFWEQCVRDAELSRRVPMLIFRRHLRADVIVLPHYEIRKLLTTYGRVKLTKCNTLFFTMSKQLMFFRLEDFLETYDSTVMREHIKRMREKEE